MDFLEMLVLAVVQGIAEFLPISSKGHLAVAEAWMHIPDALDVTIILHMGTLGSLLVYYRRELWKMLGADWRVIPLLVAATLPAVVVGLPIKNFCPWVLEDALLAGLMFPVTGALLIWASRKPEENGEYAKMSLRQALVIGLCQSVAAALPGISRSGTSIAGGLLVGLRRDQAASFAFLMAVPAIAGAGVLEAKDLWKGRAHAAAVSPAELPSAGQEEFAPQAPDAEEANAQSPQAKARDKMAEAKSQAQAEKEAAAGLKTPAWILLAGVAVSFVVGLAGLHLLIPMIQRGKLHYFAWWLIPFGIVVTIWQLNVRHGFVIPFHPAG